MDYNFSELEARWQTYWRENEIYRVREDKTKPKYYVLDMFPYPSGAGLHVGHPLGYIATDIFSRYQGMKGYNVLHPMGFDAFGLPAEQYAIETGQHPAKTTEENIATYKKQLGKIGFNYDWSREIRTSDPKYYKWTQWIFLQFFKSWYDKKEERARPISELISIFEKEGNGNIEAATHAKDIFSAENWNALSEKEKAVRLLDYRLAYLAYSEVNWCPALGTVLANDEVKDGRSERGGHPVVKRKMRQWFLRITAYADRLLYGLDSLDWPESLKDMQRNWIGRSEGASIYFDIEGMSEKLEIYTTRPDTLFGATFMVMAPEHPLVDKLTTESQRKEVERYIDYVKKRSDIERQQEKKVNGVFTGSYAVHPFTGNLLPIYISEYILIAYGTGAIMAVPSDDERDQRFAEKYGLPVIEVVDRSDYPGAKIEDKKGRMINSDFLNGLEVEEAIHVMISRLEAERKGIRTVNYKMRDAGFSRQRYWGEPFPIVYYDDVPYPLDESELPLVLPEIDSYLPTEDGRAPLARNREWVELPDGGIRETDTMPGYAGSSWYFLRYMDPHNDHRLASEEAIAYWRDVDFYMGGAEHAVGHLMYARFWHKFLYDLAVVPTDEPFCKLINQGMIQGQSKIIYRVKDENKFVSKGLKQQYDTIPIRVNVNFVNQEEVDLEELRNWRSEFKNAEFECEDGKFLAETEVEKMSKRWHNVVNPDDVIASYGADAFRMSEMFLGPIEDHKPWDTQGIDGVSKFLRKFWRLYVGDKDQWLVNEEKAEEQDLKILHKTIRKVEKDIERLSLNTCVSAFMVCVNELQASDCHHREVLEPLLRIVAPFAPHITEELWHRMGYEQSIHKSEWPSYDEKYLKESEFEYPVSVNGKLRTKMRLPLDMPKDEISEKVLANPVIHKWLDGKAPKKIIVVPGRIINIVI